MYYSWKCNDLGGQTLYAAERMLNPDAAAGYPQRCSMVDRAQSFDIVGYFWIHLIAALNHQTDYNSGIIKICRILSNGTPTDRYFQWQALVSGTNQTVTIRFGYGDGNDFTYTPTSRTYNYDAFRSMPDAERCISVIYNKGRNNYTEAGSPGWSGSTMLIIVCGQVSKQIGTYQQPSLPSYPYGRMLYTTSSYGNISDVPGGTVMCYFDNAESRANQSELVAYLVGPDNTAVSQDYNSNATLIPCAYDGSYDQETETPDPNENDPGGNSKPGGGDGGHSQADDSIPLPDLPTLGAADSGMLTLYKMSPTDMQSFVNYLYYWDPSDPLHSAWHWIKTYLGDPMDFIVGIRAIPFSPTTTRTASPKFGIFTWPQAYDVISQQFVSVSCGSLTIPKYYGSCFDYNPYNKIQIFLPGVGFRELPTDDVVGKAIEVTYHCDCLTGDCVAFVHTPAVGPVGPQKTQIIAQFGGNLGVTVPLAKVSYDATVQAGITLMSRSLGFVAGAFNQSVETNESSVDVGSMVENTTMQAVNGMKRTTERSGAAGSSIGYMSSQTPYIIRTFPRQSLPAGYKDIEGYPANLAGPLSTYRNSGFTTIEKITLTGLSATEEEKREIESLLKGGVFI